MLSGRLPLLFLCATAFLAAASAPVSAESAPAAEARSAPKLVLKELGKGAAPLDGWWQFHLGDDPSWAGPSIDDATGHDGWEQLTADKPWGAQGHPSYEGYAWYRRHISLSPAEGGSPDFALLVPAIDDVYEIYWNGAPVGHLGSFLPHPNFYFQVPAQTYGLGPVRDGVLAVRVLRLPLASNDDGTGGGFEDTPVIGSPEAIAAAKDSLDYEWLRRQQFRFGLVSLYALVSLLSFIAWLRDREQWLLFWMTIYAFTPSLDLFLNGMRLPIPGATLNLLIQAAIQIREMSQWFVLLWLLQLHSYRRLTRFVRAMAWMAVVMGTLDGALFFFYPSVFGRVSTEILDAILTVFILPPEAIPAILVAYAVVRRHRLDSARWVVAIFAFLGATDYAIGNIASQGSRFTHWTLDAKLRVTLFTVNSNPINLITLFRTLLFLSIVYAVVRYSLENLRRQNLLEQEFQNARELQQVLVPDALPSIPGFTLTSAYRPAQEVGGDFFQIIPIAGSAESSGTGGSTLIVLGDVSGKGLKAAMAVSLIVGAIRALADDYPNPAELLTQLNRRLCGRLQGGFATCIVLRLSASRECAVASAGHPAPFLNDREIDLPGALPLGLSPDAAYEETRLQLTAADHLALYTDGLLEARSASGELYGFDRLQTLFSTRPNASQATEAAVLFGQDDDITVLTLTRISVGSESSSSLAAPFLQTSTG